jgi:predicted Zn-dependent protease with MMP-like domain
MIDDFACVASLYRWDVLDWTLHTLHCIGAFESSSIALRSMYVSRNTPNGVCLYKEGLQNIYEK